MKGENCLFPGQTCPQVVYEATLMCLEQRIAQISYTSSSLCLCNGELHCQVALLTNHSLLRNVCDFFFFFFDKCATLPCFQLKAVLLLGQHGVLVKL